MHGRHGDRSHSTVLNPNISLRKKEYWLNLRKMCFLGHRGSRLDPCGDAHRTQHESIHKNMHQNRFVNNNLVLWVLFRQAKFSAHVREDSPQARNRGRQNCRWWFGRSVLLQVFLRLGSCCYLSTTLEKLMSCSRSNPLSRVSLRSADPNLSNLLLFSPAVQSRARTRHV